MISKFKTGGLYKIPPDECLYPFVEKNKEIYTSKELTQNGKSFFIKNENDYLVYIKTIIERSIFDQYVRIPIFLYDNKLVSCYTSENVLMKHVIEISIDK